MNMKQIMKIYPIRHPGRFFNIIVDWNGEFLQQIIEKWGLYAEFSAEEIGYLFRDLLSMNAARLKLLRLYRQGWFVRRLVFNDEKGKHYLYSFSESSISYYKKWNTFKDGPLISNKLERRL